MKYNIIYADPPQNIMQANHKTRFGGGQNDITN